MMMMMNVDLDSLRERHRFLEDLIADEDQRPLPDRDALIRLKVEKLQIKDAMERLK